MFSRASIPSLYLLFVLFETISLCSLAWSGISCGDQSVLPEAYSDLPIGATQVILVLNYGNFRIHFYIVLSIVFHRNKFSF